MYKVWAEKSNTKEGKQKLNAEAEIDSGDHP